MTWLYGPLHKGHSEIQAPRPSPPRSQVSTTDSYHPQRPILKKKTLAETLLQRSFSACSISQKTPCTPLTPKGNAASLVNPSSILVRSSQFYSAVSLNNSFPDLQSPATAERRRIQFNDSVEQCIALDLTNQPENIKLSCAIYEEEEDDDSSEDDATAMTLSTSSLISLKSISRSTSSRTIAFLPSTTLKSHEGSVAASKRPSLSRGTPFRKSEPERDVLQLPPPPPPPTKISTPSRYLFQDIDDGVVGLDWETDGISTYSNTSHSGVDLVQTLATPLNPYEAFKVQPQGYGECMHYDEDEHALLLELGCI